MVLEVNHKELTELIDCYYNAKIPLDITGTFGIGKSQSVREKAMQIAKDKKKEFINWNEIGLENKKAIIKNPREYFVFLDIRLSEFDISDIKGLPELTANEKFNDWLNWRIPLFAKLLGTPDSDGILFFDERNLAPPLIQSACYKIIHDRIINDNKIADNWQIISAGNTEEDKAYTYETASPLRDRCGEVYLKVPETSEWINNYAIPRNIKPFIIGFLSFKPSNLYKVDFNDKQKYTTPRGYERISVLIDKNKVDKKDFNKISLIAKSAIGEGIAQELVSFYKLSEQIDMQSIIEDPNKIKEIKEVSVKWFINTALAEQYKDKKIKFEKIIALSRALDSQGDVEFVAYLWRLCDALSKTFKKDFVEKLDKKDQLITKYATYLC